MPAFYFHLRDGKSGAVDGRAQELSCASAAQGYAVHVARELMRGRELRTRHWRLDVVDEHGGVVAEVPFATIDETLNHLTPDLRRLVERLSTARREVSETLVGLDWVALYIQAPPARSHTKPYLVARDGHRV